ncbi:MAG: CheR family methyltransferase, partial [Pseudomonadota bacterium]
ITMVQDPQQASVDGMPRAAIATGTVDSVSSVEEIGDQLVRLSRHPFYARMEAHEAAVVPSDVAHMARIFQMLRRATGIDFSNYKFPTLKRRIERRMALQRVSSLSDYLVRLDRAPAELEGLQEDLLIHVTSFFRDPECYPALENLVFPRLLERHRDDVPIRFWVPGCSTGEEVYSLVMAFLEFLDGRSATASLQIFGTDVSDKTVEVARSGTYPASIAAGISAQRLRRFFSKVEGGYRINKDVRDRCVFARQDVTRDPPFSKLDLIVCRNLLIYLNQATQRRVLRLFHYALRFGGVMMLGASETIGSQTELFTPMAKRFQIYSKKVDGDDALVDGPEGAPALSAEAALPHSEGKRGVPAPSRPAWDAQTDANRFLLDRYAPPSVVVDEDLRIVRSRGGTSIFLELPSGEVTVEVLKMVRPELVYPLRVALSQARTRGRPVSKEGVRFRVENRARIVDLHVEPLRGAEARQFLILFETRSRTPPARATASKPEKSAGGTPVALLKRELAETRQQLQSIIDDLGAANEELQSANEEILSSNEEMQSTNEELDTAKEELQSTNEELITVNDELRERNDDLSTVNGDLYNLLASVQIPIVMVTRDLRIRRVAPAAERILNVIPSDIGRPISDLKLNFDCPDLDALIRDVINTISIREREVRGADGSWFAMQIRPYLTTDNRIDGAVLVLFDISTVREHAAQLEVARLTGDALIETMRTPVLLLDGELKVKKANPAFLRAFRVSASDTERRFVYDLGNGQWNIPELRRLLEEVLPEKKKFEGFIVDHAFPDIGQRRMEVDARRIESGEQRELAILLILRDVTDHAV